MVDFGGGGSVLMVVAFRWCCWCLGDGGGSLGGGDASMD